MEKQEKVYKVGIYARLSRDDSRSGESVSIENQKLMLSRHVSEKGWELREIYQDDGFSGTNQNRPAFQRMIKDVKSGYINTILIKDLSRLGRNYLEVGNLAEVILPEYGCELISLNEPLDEMMVFRNWFNEQHSKTTSIKVRAGKKTSAQGGKFIGSLAPYGYKRDSQNRHKLAIDVNTAPIVRKMFEMRVLGMGYQAIATQLNSDGILCPKDYHYQNKGSKNPKKTKDGWNKITVREILKNEAYIGNLVSCKRGSLSYKSQKLVLKDEEHWIRIENAHEPIVDKELWHRVQSYAEKKYKPRHTIDNIPTLFVGLLFCADCGARLRGYVNRRTRKDGSIYRNVIYMCSSYADSGKVTCAMHGISETSLVELVTEHIRRFANLIQHDTEHISQLVLSAKDDSSISYRRSYIRELESHKSSLEKIDMLIDAVYTDKISGLISDNLFKCQIQKYEKEQVDLIQSIRVLEKRINSIQPVAENTETWINIMKQCTEINSVDKAILLLLIDKIIVSEVQRINNKRVRDVKVLYNYVGDIDAIAHNYTMYMAVASSKNVVGEV